MAEESTWLQQLDPRTELVETDVFPVGPVGDVDLEKTSLGTLRAELAAEGKAYAGGSAPGFLSIDGAGDYELKKCNWTATEDPTVDNDEDEGYSVASRWFNVSTGTVFECFAIDDGAANWVKVSQRLPGGSEGDLQFKSGTAFGGSANLNWTGTALIITGTLAAATLTDGTASLSGGTITGLTLTTPTIASFANAAHDHADAAGGGTLAASSVAAAGNTTELQYNLAGATAASSELTWNETTLAVAGRITTTETINLGTVDFPASALATYLGTNAGNAFTDASSYNVCVGYDAGALLETGAIHNTFVGFQSGAACTTGTSNAALGLQTLQQLTTGTYNTAAGLHALTACTTGTANNSIGAGSLQSLQTSDSNNALGMYAGRDQEGEGSVYIGHRAGMEANADNELYISNTDLTTRPDPLIYGHFTDKHVGINTVTPEATLDIARGGSIKTGLRIEASDYNLVSATFRATPTGTHYHHAKIVSGRETDTGWTYGSFLDFYTEGKHTGSTDESVLAMRIDANQFIGVGTTAPTNRLTLVDPSSNSQALAFAYSAGAANPNAFIGATNSSQNIWITAGGENTDNPNIADGFTARNASGPGTGNAAGIQIGGGAGSIRFFTATGLTNDVTYTWQGGSNTGEVFTILSSGMVGVGIQPTVTFETAGPIRMTGATASDHLSIRDDVSNTNTIGLGLCLPGTAQDGGFHITSFRAGSHAWRDDLVIDTNGYVGIGTAAPGATLDLLANSWWLNPASGNALSQFRLAGVFKGMLGWVDASSTMYFGQSGSATTGIHVTNTGNVGIGTSSPATALDVHGIVTLGDDVGNDPNTGSHKVGGTSVSDGGSNLGNYGAVIFNANSRYSAGARRWMLTNALAVTSFAIIRSTDSTTDPTLGVAGALTSGTADFVIDNTGNVGIGTDSPGTFRLNIQQDLSAADYTAGNVHLSLSGASATNKTLVAGFHTDGDYGFISTLNVGTSYGAYHLVLQPSGGYVGIGAATPTSPLDVDAADGVADNTWAAELRNREATAGRNFGLLIMGGSNGSDIALEVQDVSSTSLLRVRGDGNVGIGTDAPAEHLHVMGTGTQRLELQSTDGSVNAILNAASGAASLSWEEGGAAKFDVSYVPASNYLRFYNYTSAANQLIFTDDGSIGIGTDAPDATHLQVGTSVSSAGSPVARIRAIVGGAGTVVDALHIDCNPETNYDRGVALSFGLNHSTNHEYTSRIVHYAYSSSTRATKLHLQTHTATDAVWNDGILIDHLGCVGIGQTTPVAGIQVETAQYATLPTAAVSLQGVFQAGVTADTRYGIGVSSNYTMGPASATAIAMYYDVGNAAATGSKKAGLAFVGRNNPDSAAIEYGNLEFAKDASADTSTAVFKLATNTILTLTSAGGVIASNLPTSDPTVAGALWCDTSDSRRVKCSAG